MKKRFIFLNLFLIVLALSMVDAFGVSCSYSKESPLIAVPGSATDISVRIKSSPQEGNLKVTVEMVNNSGIATLTDKNLEYSVSPGFEGDGNVNLRINVPKSANDGQEYFVELKFIEAPPAGGEGTVSFIASSRWVIKVVVKKPEKPENYLYLKILVFFVVILAIALAAAYFFIRPKSRR